MPKAKPKNGKIRVQFDFSDELVETIDKIKEQTDSSSRAEVVRKAVHLLQKATDEGWELFVKKQGESRARQLAVF